MAWTDLPEPFPNFEALLAAAGGSLSRLLHSQLSEPQQSDPVSAEPEFLKRLQATTELRDKQDTALWRKICALGLKHGFKLPADPFFGERLRATEP
eukprot:2138743-Rhodomonas_salina.1